MSESDIQSDILKTLAYLPGYYWRSNTGTARVKGKRGFIRFGVKGGSDIEGVLPGGKSCFIEVKREGGEQSPAQIEFQDIVTELGAVYVVARSVEEMLNALTPHMRVKRTEAQLKRLAEMIRKA